MRKVPFFFLFLLFLSCGEEQNSSTTEEGILEITTIDSVILDTDNTVSFSPELIGNWKQVDFRMDGKSYLKTLEETVVTFSDNGEIIFLSEGLPPRKGEFMQVGKILSAPEIWESDLTVKELTTHKLVLTEEAAGQKVEYHYEKVE